MCVVSVRLTGEILRTLELKTFMSRGVRLNNRSLAKLSNHNYATPALSLQVSSLKSVYDWLMHSYYFWLYREVKESVAVTQSNNVNFTASSRDD